MRVITAFFRPRAPDALTAYVSVVLPLFQAGRPMCKTRNQCCNNNKLRHATAVKRGDTLVLFGILTYARVCVLLCRYPAPRSAATLTPPDSNQRPQRIAQAVEACDTSYGRWLDRACGDHG